MNVFIYANEVHDRRINYSFTVWISHIVDPKVHWTGI